MRALIPAAALLSLVSATAALAQVFPPEQPPPGSSAAPVPPPTVLLPPSASDTAPPVSSEEIPAKPKEPPPRPRHMAAVMQVLDKTTAETMRFEAPVGQPIRYKDLIFTVHVCEDTAPELGEPGAAAHLEIQSSPRPTPDRQTPPTREVFRGWMFANAPGVHPFEHPVYDAWLIGCRGAVAPPPPAPAPAASAPAKPPG